MLKRDKKAEFLEVGIVSLKYQFTSEKKYSKPPLSKAKYNKLLELQSSDPIQVMEAADVNQRWWMFQDEFFVEDEELNAGDVKAFALKGTRKKKS
ncbi:NAD-dependent aldehyde dehydrogenase [Candidatus Scalindua japonica]|uniref:NAD-dependent aldehyde dehydrogenase n=1 Tax=Candidatus Scalindua japonica TaxID=1284222 RepID=A0A286U1I4_9BACT|nr:hypothetical protein [Candidatus Scalindua japonica]GAX61987.1 NAD-dependent aldehyde dehydrogenase [Candidatus Scalindua japonica]